MTQKQQVFHFLSTLDKTNPPSKQEACDLYLEAYPESRKAVFMCYVKDAIKENKWIEGIETIDINLDVSKTNLDKPFETVNIDVSTIDHTRFVPLATGTIIDKMASKRNGWMRGTVNMLTGESGTGKTFLATNMAVMIKNQNPSTTAGFISGEMDRDDWTEEVLDNPLLSKIPTLFLLEYLDAPNYLGILKQALRSWDFCIVDSFEVILDQLKELKGWTSKKAETELIKLLRQAASESGVCLIVIQQFTKGGTYVGSTKIKHLTTSMMFALNDQVGDRYIIFTKNRRCGHMVGKKLYYMKSKKTGELEFDTKRLENLLAVKKHTDSELEQIVKDEQYFNDVILGRAKEKEEQRKKDAKIQENLVGA